MANIKIGILTFHRATNYGAVLQAYGLVSYLNSLGYDAKIIDYTPKRMAQIFIPFWKKNLSSLIACLFVNLKQMPTILKRYAKRKMFWEYIKKTLPLTSQVIMDEDLPTFDAIFVGSDQIWSTCFTGGVDKFYFGQFNSKGARLISYAGSAAEDMDRSFCSTNNAQLLNSFFAVSVREKELQTYLQKQLPRKNIVQVLDPTLMAGPTFYENLVGNSRPLSKPYILIYQVIREQNEHIQMYAKKKANDLGCVLVEIKDSKLYIDNGRGYEVNGWVDPSLFVALHKFASHVITTSFHGTAFSLMFERSFDVISISPEVDSRAKALLHLINLDDRLISLPVINEPKPLVYNAINNKLEDLRTSSRSFIESALHSS